MNSGSEANEINNLDTCQPIFSTNSVMFGRITSILKYRMFQNKKACSAAQTREKAIIKLDLTKAKKESAGDAGKKETEMELDLLFM